MKILGISAYYHDSAAALVDAGAIVACAQEERFSRVKHDSRFPTQACNYVLGEGGVSLHDLDAVVFYDKPLLKFERLLETYIGFAPRGFTSFCRAMPTWLKDKLFLRRRLERAIAALAEQPFVAPLLFAEHHQSHAASAFFPSPFDSAAVLCLDGVGEWATTSVWEGKANTLTPLWELHFPHSVGLLYSAFTYYTGFRVNSGEYKLMGLAPYGEPRYAQRIFDTLIDLKEDGTFRLNLDYFAYATGLTMTNGRFAALFGGPPRQPESAVTQREMDLARSIQVVTEEVVMRLARTVARETGHKSLCLAGGVALNCVATGRLLREGPFANVWVQPAAGDAGGALGAALAAWHGHFQQPRRSLPPAAMDHMSGSLLGPQFSEPAVRSSLQSMGARFELLDEDALLGAVTELLTQGGVGGWFRGRMEFGPRALGSRSILGDARNVHMQSTMNQKIKFRESFRPFAPIVLAEDAAQYFLTDRPAPYMMWTAKLRTELRIPTPPEKGALFGIEQLRVPRSTLPAVTHVDYSARIQTVHVQHNPMLHALLRRFKAATGMGVLVNTSFNVRGEPIVCTPSDAYRCFMRTAMDFLVVENYLLQKSLQPQWQEGPPSPAELQLD